jgi:hypothetical protein
MTANADSLRAKTAEPIVTDSHFSVTRIADGVTEHLTEDATLAMFGDRLEISFPDGSHEKLVYQLSEITGVGNFLARSVYFNCGSNLRYQMVAHKTVSVLKYYALWRVLTGRIYL